MVNKDFLLLLTFLHPLFQVPNHLKKSKCVDHLKTFRFFLYISAIYSNGITRMIIYFCNNFSLQVTFVYKFLETLKHLQDNDRISSKIKHLKKKFKFNKKWVVKLQILANDSFWQSTAVLAYRCSKKQSVCA